MLFAEKWNISPFSVLQQDIDDFILIANNMIEKTAPQNAKGTTKNTAVSRGKDDGFWDM